MNLVLLRNRPHFGAQITTIPALTFYSHNYCDDEPITLLSKNNVAWIYDQLPWVKECIQSKHQLEELRRLSGSQSLLNLRPSNRFPVILYKLIKGGQVFDLVNNGFLADLTANQYNILSEEEYRALAYLKVFIKDEVCLYNALSAPFFELANSSEFTVENAELNILMMPGGGAGEIKKWGLKNFLATGKAIAESLGKACHIHVLLGPDESEEISLMEELITGSNHLFLHTNIPIKDIAKLVDCCDITIANDCGPSHIAQCMQKPYIGIYRELNPEWFLTHTNSIKVLPEYGLGIKTIDINRVTELAINLLKNQH